MHFDNMSHGLEQAQANSCVMIDNLYIEIYRSLPHRYESFLCQ